MITPSRFIKKIRSNQLAWIGLFLMVPGCTLVEKTADLPGDAVRVVTKDPSAPKPVDPVEIQQMLLRFSDELSAHLVAEVDNLQIDGAPLDRMREVRLKLAFSTDIWSIAVGPNVYANLLDMMVVVKLLRLTLEERWLNGEFGESARGIITACRKSEDRLWDLSSLLLTEEQKRDLEAAVMAAKQSYSNEKAVLSTRAIGFTTELQGWKSGETNRSSSLYSMLMIDPLAGLDPAAREIAETRLFAERAFFITQRMPDVLRWQAELLGYESADTPEVQSLLATAESLSQSAERLSKTAEDLPEVIRTEREAIVEAMAAQEPALTQLVSESKEALVAGERMATATESTLRELDRVVANLTEKPADAPPPDPDAEPFKIQDLTEAAAQLEQTATSLEALLVRFDDTVGSDNLTKFQADLQDLSENTRQQGEQLVNYIFWRVLLLIVVAAGAGLASVTVYRQWIR